MKKFSLITGAAGLLGAQHADALASVGHNLILLDLNIDGLFFLKQELNKKYKQIDVITECVDITNFSDLCIFNEKLINDCFVNVLINNACIDFKPKNKSQESFTQKIDSTRIEDFDIEQWNKEIAVGLSGAFNMIKLFGPIMSRKKEGNILNIASDLSIISPDQRLYSDDHLSLSNPVKPITYSVIKHGLIGLTKYVSTYWAKNNVRCNAISPGGVFNDQPDEFVRKLSELIPLGRMARLDEYKKAIIFLCTDDSSYMNGHNLVIDGGRSII